MYSGFSKNNGSVIGDTSKGCEIDIEEAQDSTAAEESMICMDDTGNEIVLTSKIDKETGDLTWCQMYQKGEVMQRTIGMSQMTSMMRDEDRNRVYEKAILILLNKFAEEHGRAPIVLDIGAGTGLLSMMAVRGGAEFALGVEMFDAMSTVAENVINSNDFGDKILIINAKSSEIEDLPVPADMLISELLDSALLGEGCLPSHIDAMERLMNPLETTDGSQDGVPDYTNRVLPYSGIVFGTLIESVEVKHMHDSESIALGGEKLHKHRTPPEIALPPCKGGIHLIPLHWAEVQQRGGRELSASVKLLHPNFTLTTSTEVEEFSTPDHWYYTDITATSDGTVHGVLLWWNLYLLSPQLDPSRDCCYSTAPGVQNWQDHWQQTVCPLPEDIAVQQGDVLRVYAMHDQVQIQLHAIKLSSTNNSSTEPDCKRQKANTTAHTTTTATTTDTNATTTTVCMTVCSELPTEIEEDSGNICTCGWHNLCGAERFQTMCDTNRSAVWDSAIEKVVTSLPPQSTGLVLDLGDGSLLGLTAARQLKELNSTVQVVSKESKLFSRMFFGQMAMANALEEQLTVWDGEDLSELALLLTPQSDEDEKMDEENEEDQEEEEVDLTVLKGNILAIVGECHYYQLQALPTWQMLAFYYQVQSLRRQELLSPQCRVLPGRALVRALPLELPHLRRCHGLAGM